MRCLEGRSRLGGWPPAGTLAGRGELEHGESKSALELGLYGEAYSALGDAVEALRRDEAGGEEGNDGGLHGDGCTGW